MTKDGTVRAPKSDRPTGIIRTLPSLYGIDSPGSVRYKSSLEALERGRLDAVYVALQAKPRIEVLHMYLIIEGRIHVRLNIAGYVAGDERECWDRTIRKPKFWAVCCAPVSWPPGADPAARISGNALHGGIMVIVANVCVYANGQVMTFDEVGKQIPEFQGRAKDVLPRVLDVALATTEYFIGDWSNGIVPTNRSALTLLAEQMRGSHGG